jgi:hypothetical protein
LSTAEASSGATSVPLPGELSTTYAQIANSESTRLITTCCD